MRLQNQGTSSGTIFLNNQPLKTYTQKELARAVSYVPQAGGWIPPFSIAELLRLSRYPYSTYTSGFTTTDVKAVDRALHLTNLTHLASRPLKTLSGGERQKAYLAAALAQEAKLLLLDEPASFLDPRHAADLNQLLRRLNQNEGLTFITVTHDLNHPSHLKGLALILADGENLFFGSFSELLKQSLLEKAFQHKFIQLVHPLTGDPVIIAE
jgi:iron complex transport system ATP-binding protein